jgi:pimeloyl-ACP methyl ester carboxylesterase
MTVPLVIFSHGQESGPWGTKIQAMARAVQSIGWRAVSIDYRGIVDPDARVERLVAECGKLAGPRVLVGSSMGGHVATAAASQVRALGLFVLAPAYYIEEWQVETPPAPDIPIVIVHGWRDEVVPVENSIRYARECRATLHVVDGDHRLTDHIDAINDYLQRFLGKLWDPSTGTTGAK